MKVDYVMPDGNEKEFIKIAERLGIKTLFFLYPENKEKDISEYTRKTKLEIEKGIILTKTPNKNTAKNTFVKENTFNRKTIERRSKLFIISPRYKKNKDFMHHRASELNHILCRIAGEKEKTIIFDFSDLLKDRKNRAKNIGRTAQNIRLCNKYNIKTGIGSFARNPFELRGTKDLKALFKIMLF